MTVDPTKGSPFPGLTFVGELDGLRAQKMEVTMQDDWTGYLNQQVLVALQKEAGRPTHLRFLPDPNEGMVIMIPTNEAGDYGATELRYTDTENGAEIHLRRAVQRLKVRRLAGRIRVFPVIERQAPDGMIYLAFVVKNSRTRPARKLKPSVESAAGKQGPPDAGL